MKKTNIAKYIAGFTSCIALMVAFVSTWTTNALAFDNSAQETVYAQLNATTKAGTDNVAQLAAVIVTILIIAAVVMFLTDSKGHKF